MNEETERRLKKLIDIKAHNNDAWYHAQVSVFRSWLTAAEMAMRDEGVANRTIQAVLNRMVYGAPSPTDPEGKMVTLPREEIERLMRNQQPRSALDFLLGTARPNSPGHRDVSDLYTDKGPHTP